MNPLLVSMGHYLAWIAGLSLPFVAQGAEASTTGSTRPNIVFILADDLGWRDLSCFGSTFYETPNIDALAQRGIKFTQAYAASPVCSPTRASILSGLHPARIGITRPACALPEAIVVKQPLPPRAPAHQKAITTGGLTRLSRDFPLLSEVLRGAGYATAHVGKWHCGWKPYGPDDRGFDFAWPKYEMTSSYFAPYPMATETGSVDTNAVPAPPGEHLQDRATDEAIRWLQANPRRPFFLNYWAFLPHSPLQAHADLIAKYQARVDPANPQHNPVYAAMIETLDRNVGRLLRAITAIGAADNTIVVFSSDNGGVDWRSLESPTSNRPLREGKGTTYDGGTRVPLIISATGRVKAGSVSDTPVMSMDLYPTLLEMAGVAPKAGSKCDGVSITPAFSGGSLPREALYSFWPHYAPGAGEGGRPAVWVRRGDMKLIRFFADNPDQTDRFELYDLAADPGEQRNVAAERSAAVAGMNRLLDRFLAETEAVVPRPNPGYRADAKAVRETPAKTDAKRKAITRPAAAPAVKVTALQVEHRVDPVGIDTAKPRLSWQLSSSERDVAQTACRILVASSVALLQQDRGDVWDSGRIESNQSLLVSYGGRALRSSEECFWKVRAWAGDAQPSDWSEPARWSMGLLRPEDWKGKWIGLDGEPHAPATKANGGVVRELPARMLRREFTLSATPKRAVLYASGLGLSEFYINGAKVGDHVLSPGLTDYDKRIYYVTHDVTRLLQAGANCVGAWLGNGRYYGPRFVAQRKKSYGFPKLLLQLRIEQADGRVTEVVSDESWRLTTDGPIRANSEFDGEIYDARREQEGWSQPGFNDARWQAAPLVSAPGGVLSAQMIDPIRVTGSLPPVGLTEPRPGVYVFDFGQNMVGWCRLRVRGAAGTVVTLRHAETLQPDGTLFMANLRSAKVTDTYTLKGGGLEVWEPRFTYHGFRYVELTGLPGRPDLATLEGRVVNDDLASGGSFACSHPLLNRIYTNILWGVRGNYRSIPTDCPQRDERQGWLGDRAIGSHGETYLFRTAAFYAKWMQDIADAQLENGSLPDVAPPYWNRYSDNVTWPSTFLVIPGTLYRQYGDRQVVARMYPAMVRWVELLRGSLKDDISQSDRYGDWCVPPEEPGLIHAKDPARKTAPRLLATAYFYHCLQLMEQYALLLGHTGDAHRWRELGAKIATAFHREFFRSEVGYYDNGSQTSCILPLAFKLTPPAQTPRVFDRLVDKITVETNHHVGTGLIGAQWLMRTLSDHGRTDLAYTLATQRTYPSWGYMVDQGATTLWELWNGDTADPAMNSMNHVMLSGDLVIWLFEYLAGIRADPAAPGFKHILMRPHVVGDLKWVQAKHDSPYGLIRSEWRLEGDNFTWDVTVPGNSTATLHFPFAGEVREGGRPLASVAAVRVRSGAAHPIVLEAGSGTFAFHCQLAPNPSVKPAVSH